ncbi:MAG: hypothetical protein DMF99_18490 [Acidobacteria bacterium]|nr:MAG: hypothetical protein DMF99_18490 [Acidobacteriota bacterium]
MRDQSLLREVLNPERVADDRARFTARRKRTGRPASARRAARRLRGRTVTIASMKPGKALCEMVTVDEGRSTFSTRPVVV